MCDSAFISQRQRNGGGRSAGGGDGDGRHIVGGVLAVLGRRIDRWAAGGGEASFSGVADLDRDRRAEHELFLVAQLEVLVVFCLPVIAEFADGGVQIGQRILVN